MSITASVSDALLETFRGREWTPRAHPSSMPWTPDRQSENTTIALSRAEATSIASLARVYGFQDDARMRAFLRERPHLVGLLIEAIPEVYTQFGIGAPIILDVVRDWGSQSGPELYARIRTRMEPHDAMRTLERFDRGWWLGALERAKGELTFTIQLV